ncbi:MAG: metallophosphoesterase, partial [Halobacteriota archaeon]
GHSHGGQFIIPSIGTLVKAPHAKKYPLGRYQVGDMVHYTSRGLGTNVFWIRVNCPPEITIFTLAWADGA